MATIRQVARPFTLSISANPTLVVLNVLVQVVSSFLAVVALLSAAPVIDEYAQGSTGNLSGMVSDQLTALGLSPDLKTYLSVFLGLHVLKSGFIIVETT